MAQLTRALGNFPAIARVVLDRTGLAGNFDWKLEWTPSLVAGPNGDAAPVTNPNAGGGTSDLYRASRAAGPKARSGAGHDRRVGDRPR